MTMKSDLERVDLGIAMSHFALTAAEAGLNGQWQVQDPHLGGVTEKWDYVVSWRDVQ